MSSINTDLTTAYSSDVNNDNRSQLSPSRIPLSWIGPSVPTGSSSSPSQCNSQHSHHPPTSSSSSAPRHHHNADRQVFKALNSDCQALLEQAKEEAKQLVEKYPALFRPKTPRPRASSEQVKQLSPKQRELAERRRRQNYKSAIVYRQAMKIYTILLEREIISNQTKCTKLQSTFQQTVDENNRLKQQFFQLPQSPPVHDVSTHPDLANLKPPPPLTLPTNLPSLLYPRDRQLPLSAPSQSQSFFSQPSQNPTPELTFQLPSSTQPLTSFPDISQPLSGIQSQPISHSQQTPWLGDQPVDAPMYSPQSLPDRFASPNLSDFLPLNDLPDSPDSQDISALMSVLDRFSHHSE